MTTYQYPPTQTPNYSCRTRDDLSVYLARIERELERTLTQSEETTATKARDNGVAWWDVVAALK